MRNASTLMISLNSKTLSSLKSSPNLKLIGIVEACKDGRYLSYKKLTTETEEFNIDQQAYGVFREEIFAKLKNFYTV